ncbi:class I SAM-dependent methyltransferase [Luteolibacter yonseiensis]|uniref:Class I SAM-dependent methyltransferase n=1 Tax=Luteolibacter yonseiensis TaxID=1144680 RepID=A0A934R5F7_9BACT|nr:class I SAM-dependent methyltransferase [Luteolibacter yonseiensis]MBK1817317.1 class I SAM-dependent methyltransferase [Luteolibacter yonseiensis]
MNFDRIAPFYRAMEFLTAGGKLQKCRTAFLDEIPIPQRVLIAGEGHGRFLPECAAKFPDARITVLDSSGKMLDIARRRTNSPQVEFVLADILDWDGPAGGYDLIVTNFFLDCFSADTLPTVISRLGDLATPRAHWLLADFQIASGKMPALRCRAILALLYAFFHFVCQLQASKLVPPDGLLSGNGFIRHRIRESDWGLLKSEWWHRTSREIESKCQGEVH